MSIDEVMRQFTAELDVCCDALLRAGWPPSRMLQDMRQEIGHSSTRTILLTKGIEFSADLPVFEAGYRFVERDDGLACEVFSRWLVEPLPMPHSSTIARANIEAREATRE